MCKHIEVAAQIITGTAYYCPGQSQPVEAQQSFKFIKELSNFSGCQSLRKSKNFKWLFFPYKISLVVNL